VKQSAGLLYCYRANPWLIVPKGATAEVAAFITSCPRRCFAAASTYSTTARVIQYPPAAAVADSAEPQARSTTVRRVDQFLSVA
jgi:hypothetical protein